MPIGNLTSQIFANIYFNEFDRFVKHTLKPKAYLRYGDDFILIESDLQKLHALRLASVHFLEDKLKLRLNPKSDRILKAKWGLKYLGVVLWSSGRKLNKRNIRRSVEKLNNANVASYRGLVIKHGTYKLVRYFHWLIHEKIIAKFQ